MARGNAYGLVVLVWHWNEQGCPSVCSASAMPSFEGFFGSGTIVMTAGFISFTKRPATTDGDVQEECPGTAAGSPADKIQPGRRKRPHTY